MGAHRVISLDSVNSVIHFLLLGENEKQARRADKITGRGERSVTPVLMRESNKNSEGVADHRQVVSKAKPLLCDIPRESPENGRQIGE